MRFPPMATPKKAPKTSLKASPKTSPKPKKAAKAKKSKPESTEAIVAQAIEISENGTGLLQDAASAPEAASSVSPDAVPVAEVEVAAIVEQLAEEAKTEAEAEDSPEPEAEAEPEFIPQPRPPAKLERLQKILAAAGVASRRAAEGLIEQGRVQINGKIVTVLGTKADAARDHIRVDGKLLQGAERLRYFVLNKPRGFVTTVKDPEGRPTVMQFFDKMKERLYPVGRLDYMSEGLLVVTNDGELANRLTKAASGVEKTYLIKVAGQPTEAELDILRNGVAIAVGAPGSRSVRTSPARIRQVRQGDNPWYEVVLIEGRNRELRKMFEEIGHFVEKIRRTGYGPLVLDQEPGNLRELLPEEVAALRLAAEGKLRTPKSKDLRRRNLLDAGLLPTVLPKPSSRPRTAPPSAAFKPRVEPSGGVRPKTFGGGRPVRSADSFASGEANKLFRPARPAAEGFRPASGRTSAPNSVRSFSRSEDERPRRRESGGGANFGSARPGGRSFDRAEERPDARPSARPAPRPAWKQDDRPARPPFDRAHTGAPSSGSAHSGAARPFTPRPAWKKPERTERTARPEFKRPIPIRPAAPVRNARDFDDDLGPVRPPNLHIEEITASDRPTFDKRAASRPSGSRPALGRPTSSRPSAPRPYSDRPSAPRSYTDRPRRSFDRSTASDRPDSGRPNADRSRPGRPSFSRPEGSRPYSTSSGKPRAGGARPSSKPGRLFKPGSPRPTTPRSSQEGASDYRPTASKPYPNSASRAERKAGPGWKPKPKSGGWKPGGSAKPSFRGKSGTAKRTGGKPSGKKRNY